MNEEKTEEKMAQETEEKPETVKTKTNADALTKADPVKRIIAFVIDAVASMIVGFIPLVGGIIGALYMLLRDALPIEALEYKSIGKKLLKLSVVKTEEPASKIDYATSARRNWMFALGPIMLFFLFIPIIGWIIDILLGIAVLILVIIEIVKLFTNEKGLRWGDKMAGTMVIEK
ncbi:MAG TPA: RDD family protein [Desulfatiglandales bacterium]|nr:RDD family protein [Desulfatiglandales bacterium]